MRVSPVTHPTLQEAPFLLLDDADHPIEVVTLFLRFLAARDYSPNTLRGYAYDLLHFFRFLHEQQLTYREFLPRHALDLLAYLHSQPRRRPSQRLSLAVCTREAGIPTTHLAAAPVNRIFAAVSSFYDYLIMADQYASPVHPIVTVDDPALQRVAERHRPFLGQASHQRPIRRHVKVKTVQRVPRPLSEDQVSQLLGGMRHLRDRALILLMLQGGLRPGEVLNLRLSDIQYGRRRVVIRHYVDHPKGVRTKSRQERMVDLHEPEALQALNAYIMTERPREATTAVVFLVGGKGQHRLEPLGYPALVKLFARACERVGIREPWLTPHALRHTHATRMWEGGMRELTLQKRLGHASPESTRLYTRVSDPQVVAEYRQAIREDQA